LRVVLFDAVLGAWIEFQDAVGSIETTCVEDVAAVICTVENRTRSEGLHAVGFLSYEAASGLNPSLATGSPGALPLCWFAFFRNAIEIECPAPPDQPPQLNWTPSIDETAYRHGVARIRGYIEAGDTYQVNFTYRLRAALEETLAHSPYPLFTSMLSRQNHGYGAYIDTEQWAICSASPELFFDRRGQTLASRPMKGTVRRGCNPAEDARLGSWLRTSVKNRAENLMVTDMVRNDLGRISQIGSVRVENVFQLERYPTLWQLTSAVSATCDQSLLQILRALFPAASITGAPKRRSMEIIRELETEPRQIYTGSIGYLRNDGTAQFNVAIRTALVNKQTGMAEYGVGGGIVWDSDAADEYQECSIKAQIVRPHLDPFQLLETLLWTPEKGFALLDAHLLRLRRSAEFFGRSPDPEQMERQLDQLAGELPHASHRVRLLVDGNGATSVSAAPLDDLPDPFRVAVTPFPQAVLNNPYVAHKTTRRDIYDAALESVNEVDDVLLWNHRGEVTESTIANVFIERTGELVTPPVTAGLLPGVYRQRLLESGKAHEQTVTVEDLRRAQAIYLGNSVRGLWAVELVENGTVIVAANQSAIAPTIAR
jgi:para-aminobenzoate synthetase/4-amino-4-deoxychorismate lyase